MYCRVNVQEWQKFGSKIEVMITSIRILGAMTLFSTCTTCSWYQFMSVYVSRLFAQEMLRSPEVTAWLAANQRVHQHRHTHDCDEPSSTSYHTSAINSPTAAIPNADSVHTEALSDSSVSSTDQADDKIKQADDDNSPVKSNNKYSDVKADVDDDDDSPKKADDECSLEQADVEDVSCLIADDGDSSLKADCDDDSQGKSEDDNFPTKPSEHVKKILCDSSKIPEDLEKRENN